MTPAQLLGIIEKAHRIELQREYLASISRYYASAAKWDTKASKAFTQHLQKLCVTEETVADPHAIQQVAAQMGVDVQPANHSASHQSRQKTEIIPKSAI